ncbi:uncharacterized protein LOC110943002 [Helianthus annuus]|uniref:uncharacterized protein LOC110943002 n=1 Tax=Helianthus annuus TaxID=4232 RepID=UPI000B8F2ADC|nr:uncharacterized protein LOC110943002 [Helianthus annuus]
MSPRTITNAGFNLDATVGDMWVDGSWIWPLAWRDVYPVLIQDNIQIVHKDMADRVLWKHGNELHDHSSAIVWQSIRTREPDVDWVCIVWFAQCIPKHAFLMWLIMRRKLLTQDKILQWDFSRRKNMNMMCCLLCYADYDSHHHLFFECNFSSQVWNLVRGKVGMDNVEPKWSVIVDRLCSGSSSKSASSYVSKLVVTATAYAIWQERNARLFKNHARPPDAIGANVLQTVRYKLMGVKFKAMEKCEGFFKLGIFMTLTATTVGGD